MNEREAADRAMGRGNYAEASIDERLHDARPAGEKLSDAERSALLELSTPDPVEALADRFYDDAVAIMASAAGSGSNITVNPDAGQGLVKFCVAAYVEAKAQARAIVPDAYAEGAETAEDEQAPPDDVVALVESFADACCYAAGSEHSVPWPALLAYLSAAAPVADWLATLPSSAPLRDLLERVMVARVGWRGRYDDHPRVDRGGEMTCLRVLLSGMNGWRDIARSTHEVKARVGLEPANTPAPPNAKNPVAEATPAPEGV